MSSLMWEEPHPCPICFETVALYDNFVDADDQMWDVHKGECARKAGLDNGTEV